MGGYVDVAPNSQRASGYMDFAGSNAQHNTTGYVDVAPNSNYKSAAGYVDVAPSNNQNAAGYVDVAPNSEMFGVESSRSSSDNDDN